MADKKVNIIIDVKGTEDAKGKLQDTGKAAESAASRISSAWLAVGAAVGALAGTFALIKDSMQKAAVEESAINKLNNVLKVSGSYSKTASQNFIDFADSIEKASIYGNELVLNQVALVKSMGYTDAQTKYLITSATKLSTTMGVDLDTATNMLLGTLTGVAGRMAKLSPELKDMSAEQLKAGGAIKFFADKGVEASTVLDTYEGKTHQFGVAIDDLQKAFGRAIISNKSFLEWIQATAEFIGSLSAKEVKLQFDLSSAKTANDKLEILLNNYNQLQEAIDDPATPIEEMDKFQKQLDTIGLQIIELRKIISFPLKGRVLGNFSQELDETIANMAGFETAAINVAKVIGDVQTKTTVKNPGFTPAITAEQKKTAKETDINYAMYEAQLQVEMDYNAKSMQLAEERKSGVISTDAELQIQQLESEYLYQEELLRIRLEADLANAKLLDDKFAREKAQYDASFKYSIDKEKLVAKKNKDKSKLELDEDKKTADDKKAILSSSLSAGASLMSQKNAELFRIGQASAIASATMSTYEGVGKAWGYGPILGPILAGVVLAAGLANVATIASTKPPKFATGGIFNPNGTSISGDSNTARLNDREMVLNMQQQANLLSIATNGGGSSMTNEILINLTNVMANKNFAVDLDGERLNNRLTEINDRRLK